MADKRVRRITFVPAIKPIEDGYGFKKKVAAYARVSTGSEEQETSLEAQRDYYERYIKNNNSWTFVDVYYDDGISGLSYRNREGFNNMVTDALEGKIDLILTKSLSRFARNTVDALVTIRKLKERGVEVYFEKEDIHTLDSKGEFLITLMSSLAQEESRSISENIAWGCRKRFADGKYTMPYALFLGYEKGPNGTPIINEEQAQIVRLIYWLYLVGFTEHGINRILTQLELPLIQESSKHWHTSVITSILQNEKYKGDALLQKGFTVDFLTKKRKMNEGELPQYYLEKVHPAIVSDEAFALVQYEIHRRKKLNLTYSSTKPLSSKIICDYCGSYFGMKSMHKYCNNKRYYADFWRCNRYYDNHCDTAKLRDEIVNMLMDYKGNVTVKIDGIAASAASVIAMAGTEVLMSPVSMLMIHNPMTVAMGDSSEMEKAIEMLASVKDSILNAYEIKTGLSRAKLSHLMDAETWMDATKALEFGFADGILSRPTLAVSTKEETEEGEEENKSEETETAVPEKEEKDDKPKASMLFSRKIVETNLKNKLRHHMIAEAAKITPKEAEPSGRKVDDLYDRLNLLKY